MNLQTPITALHRVGKVLARQMKRLEIHTVKDLLFYFPFRYEDFSNVVSIRAARPDEDITIKARIELIANKRSPRKRKIITEAVVSDETGRMRVVWFGQPFITRLLHVGETVYFSGKVKSDMFGAQMVGPSYERVTPPSPSPTRGGKGGVIPSTTHTARIVPMYSLTEGITQKQIRFLVSQVIELAKNIKDWLPSDIRQKGKLISLPEAIKGIHFPDSGEELKQAEKRLKFDELFVLQLRAEMIRQAVRSAKALIIEFKEKETKEFVSSLPYQLTKAQKVAAWEILQDLGKSEPMNRLMAGDVGSGKTVVAALTAYNTVLNGYQVALMAPTEILARQHFETFAGFLSGFGVRVVLFTRSQKMIIDKEINGDRVEINGDSEDKLSQSISTYLNVSRDLREVAKSKLIADINTGDIRIIIGTHTLLSENLQFRNLGLAIVDEQHRFGVEQRKILCEKSGGENLMPHFLSLTATPIPRSLALTLYGDLDLSTIREMPPGRKSIKTRLVEPHLREKAYAFIREQVKAGRQVFVICPLIKEQETMNNEQDTTSNYKHQTSNNEQSTINNQQSDERYAIRLIGGQVSDKKSVMEEYEKLSQHIFPDLRIGYLHGRLKASEKNKTMEQFNSRTIDILVSTSVVEVGVDIPNASVMMIEGAERFGLAQLHQFRGRVGRSTHQSYCFLFTEADSVKVGERLNFFEQTTDGFALAEYDLQTRGPGEVYGTVQSGLMNFRLATMKDVDLMKLSRDLAKGIDFHRYPLLRERVEEWEKMVHLE